MYNFFRGGVACFSAGRGTYGIDPSIVLLQQGVPLDIFQMCIFQIVLFKAYFSKMYFLQWKSTNWKSQKFSSPDGSSRTVGWGKDGAASASFNLEKKFTNHCNSQLKTKKSTRDSAAYSCIFPCVRWPRIRLSSPLPSGTNYSQTN